MPVRALSSPSVLPPAEPPILAPYRADRSDDPGRFTRHLATRRARRQPPAPGVAAPQNPTSTSLSALADGFDKRPDTIVADVNGTPITLGMVADRLRDFPATLGIMPPSVLYKGALDDLIQQRALAAKAKELGLDKLPTMQRRISEAADRELGAALFRQLVPEMVTDQAIEKTYKDLVAGKPGPDEVQFSVIATPTKAEAMSALDLLRNGRDFAELATKISQDPSALAGGEIDYTRPENLTPEIRAVAFALAPGETTAFPVLSNNAWFIIRVEARRQQGTPNPVQARAVLSGELTRAAIARIGQQARASVTVKDYGETGARGRDQGAEPKSR